MKTGVELIAEERARQIEVEKFDDSHDEDHSAMQLSGAAGCYIASAMQKHANETGCMEKENNTRFQVWAEGYQGPNGKWRENRWIDAWPWDSKYDKREKHDIVRSLVIAGALIAAEIDRLQNL